MRGIIGNPDSPIEGTNSDPTGFMHLTRVIAEGNGRPGAVHVWVNAVSGSGIRSQAQRFIIYQGDINPAGNVVLAVTDEILVDQTTPVGQWVKFNATYVNGGTPAVLQAGQAYWIGWWSGPSVNSGLLVYGWRQAAIPNAAWPSGLGTADLTEAYSSTGLPPTAPNSFANSGRQYLMYFDIGDGAAMPGNVITTPAGINIPVGSYPYGMYEQQDDLPAANVGRF